MGLFKKLFKNKNKLPPEALRWNKMIDMWCDETLPKPYQQLVDYDNGVQGEGHFFYFLNNEEVAEEIIAVLQEVLPPVLRHNLIDAYNSYKNEIDEDSYAFDKVYMQNQDWVQTTLQNFADTLTLD